MNILYEVLPRDNLQLEIGRGTGSALPRSHTNVVASREEWVGGEGGGGVFVLWFASHVRRWIDPVARRRCRLLSPLAPPALESSQPHGDKVRVGGRGGEGGGGDRGWWRRLRSCGARHGGHQRPPARERLDYERSQSLSLNPKRILLKPFAVTGVLILLIGCC